MTEYLLLPFTVYEFKCLFDGFDFFIKILVHVCFKHLEADEERQHKINGQKCALELTSHLLLRF